MYKTHIHWVARQNKLEIPRDKDEVNKREIHEFDGREHDPDTMVTPLTPKSTHTAESLSRVPPTIVLCREEDTTVRNCLLLIDNARGSGQRYCCCLLLINKGRGKDKTYI